MSRLLAAVLEAGDCLWKRFGHCGHWHQFNALPRICQGCYADDVCPLLLISGRFAGDLKQHEQFSWGGCLQISINHDGGRCGKGVQGSVKGEPSEPAAGGCHFASDS